MVKRPSPTTSRLQRAFTLIELIAVIIILTILTFASVATYITVSNNLSTDVAKGYVAQVVSAEVQYASNNGVYADDPSVLTGLQKGITVTSGNATGAGDVSIAIDTTTNRLGLATMNESGTCILEVADAATEGAPTQSVTFLPGSPCNGTSALTTTTQTQVVDTSQTYDSILKTYSPTAWWKLSDSLSSPTAADDATGAAYPGNVNGDVTFGQSGGPDSPGDAAALFSGNADVTTGLNPNGYTGLTISAWVDLNGATPSGAEALVGDESSGSSGLDLSLAGPDGLSPSVTIDTTNGPTTLTSTTEITNDSWYELAATYDGSTLTLYLDGFAADSTPLSGSVVASTGLTIGQNGNNHFYTSATLAQVSIFNSAISPDNLATLYEAAYTPPTVETLSILNVTAGTDSALVAWTDPDPPTGLTGYIATASPGGLTCSTVSATSCTVSGLTSGVAYTFTVQQNTATGLGTISAPSASVVDTITVPAAPTDVTAQTASSSVNVTWSAPVDNGGSPIVSYEVQYASSPFTTWSVASTNVSTTSYSVTGLSTGTPYEFRVAASNEQGQGPYQSTASAQVNAGVPSAPLSLAAVPSNAAIGVSWLAPTSNGGTAITSYVATAQPGNFSCSTTGALNCSITGLANGTAYTIDVVAINAIGTSVPAVLTIPVTPFSVPTAPLNPVGVPGDTTATITWSAPASNGGSPITLYTVTSSPGAFTCTSVTTLSCTVTGLTDGTSYTFTVVATNAAGAGPASLPSPSVVPAAPPGAPTSVVASNINGIAYGSPAQASISWNAPSASGTTSITGYAVTSSPGSRICDTTGATTCIVTGLTAGTSYTFSVVATNSAGNSPAGVSPAFTPYTIPQAPISPILGTPTATTAPVSWTAPASGGSAITSYTVTSSPGALTCTTASTTCTVTGLTAGTTYSFSVTATNPAGTSTASTVAETATVPSAPLNPTAVPANASAIVSWSIPFSNGGSTITLYTVTSSPGALTCTTASTTCTVTGLTNATGYTFTVTATNADGTGPGATTSPPIIPAAVPSAPISVIATPGSTQATISWSAPASTGGSPIIGYTVTSVPGYFTCTTTGATTCVVSGLTNGTRYSFSAVATNDIGTGPASSGFDTLVSAFSPAAWYTLNDSSGSTSAADSSGNNNTLTTSGTVTFNRAGPIVPSPGDTGALFSSSALSGASGLGESSAWSVGLWAKTSTSSSLPAAISIDVPGSWPDDLAILYIGENTENGGTRVYWNNASALTTNTSVVDGTWHYYVLELSGTTLSLYIDGSLAASSTVAPESFTPTSLSLGATNDNGSLVQNFNGSLSEVTVFNYPLSSTQIATLDTAGGVTPTALPGAPTAVAATPGSMQASVSWTAPSSTGGSPITSYTVTSSPGGFTCTATTTPTCIVTGLTNGTAYTFTVTATNADGTGPASASSSPVTPALSVPGAPTAVTAVSTAPTTLTVSWTAPGYTGTSPISLYTVTSSPGGFTCTSATTTCVVTGLSAANSYTFTVTATNAGGTGPASSPSAAYFPYTAPGAPTNISAVAGASQATLSWTAPTSTGGSAVTGYSVQYSSNGGTSWTTATASTPSSPYTVTGLTAGTTYVFQVRAITVLTAGPYSTSAVTLASNATLSSGQSLTSPNGQFTLTMQTDGNLVEKNGSTVVFASGTSGNPGAYVTMQGDGNLVVYLSGTALWASGTSGNAGAFLVLSDYGTLDIDSTSYVTLWTASNSGAGYGLVSNATLASNGSIYSPNGTYRLSMQGDGNLVEYNGSTVVFASGTSGHPGASVTMQGDGNLVIYLSGTALWASNTGGINPGSSLIVNDSGLMVLVPPSTGLYAATEATPTGTTPGAPLSVATTPGASQATVSWNAPSSNGGSPITSYVATASPGSATCTTSLTTCTITGLTNATTYTITVTATNQTGTGPASSSYAQSIATLSPSAFWKLGDASGSTTAIDSSGNGHTATVVGTTNLLSPANSIFSTGVGTWVNGYNATLTQSSAQSLNSTYSLATSSQAASNGGEIAGTQGGGFNQTGPGPASASAGNTYTGVASFRAATSPRSVILYIDFFNSSGTQISQTQSTPIVDSTSGWTQASVSAVAPSGTSSVGLIYDIGDTLPSIGVASTSEVHYVDDAGIFQGPNTTWVPSGTQAGTQLGTVSPGGAPSASSALFDGSTGYINTGYTPSGSALSVSVWFDPTSTQPFAYGNRIFSAGGGGSTSGIELYMNGTGGTITALMGNGTTYVSTSSLTAPAANKWHLAVLSYNGSTLSLYLDGVFQSSTALTGTVLGGSSAILGQYSGSGDAFSGNISNVAILPSAITATQDTALYTTPVVTPYAAPSAPTNPVATVANAGAVVYWNAPSTNGSPITLYTVTSSPGGFTCTSTVDNCSITGLTNGTSYTYTVTATNAAGTGPASAASAAVIPAVTTVPSAPLSVTATPGAYNATVSWSAPSSNGNLTISQYTVTSSPGGLTCTTSGTLSCTVSGLTGGTNYTFSVTATNSLGAGPASAASNSITPITVPAAPSGLSATGPNSTLSVTESWSAPSTGGTPITDYLVRTSPDNATWTQMDTSSTSTGYTWSPSSTATFYVQVAAVNSAGQGPWSSSDTVSWTLTGSYPIYGYVCVSGGTLSGSTCTISGSYGATATANSGYTCPSDWSPPTGSSSCSRTTGGTQANCLNNGGSWNAGSGICTLFTSGSYGPNGADFGYTYSCPSGGSLSGTTCYTTSTYGATYEQTSTGYYYAFRG
jgi:titin